MGTHAVLRRYADAWLAGDIDALFAAYADDAVFHYFGETDLAGDHVGKDACLAAMITVSSRAPRDQLEVVDVLAGDVLGAIVVRERLAGTHVVERAFLYRVEGDRIAECWLYDQDQRLIDRLWSATTP